MSLFCKEPCQKKCLLGNAYIVIQDWNDQIEHTLVSNLTLKFLGEVKNQQKSNKAKVRDNSFGYQVDREPKRVVITVDSLETHLVYIEVLSISDGPQLVTNRHSTVHNCFLHPIKIFHDKTRSISRKKIIIISKLLFFFNKFTIFRLKNSGFVIIQDGKQQSLG